MTGIEYNQWCMEAEKKSPIPPVVSGSGYIGVAISSSLNSDHSFPPFLRKKMWALSIALCSKCIASFWYKLRLFLVQCHVGAKAEKENKRSMSVWWCNLQIKAVIDLYMYVMVPSEKPWQPSVCILEDARNSLPGSYIFFPGLFFIIYNLNNLQ